MEWEGSPKHSESVYQEILACGHGFTGGAGNSQHLVYFGCGTEDPGGTEGSGPRHGSSCQEHESLPESSSSGSMGYFVPNGDYSVGAAYVFHLIPGLVFEIQLNNFEASSVRVKTSSYVFAGREC